MSRIEKKVLSEYFEAIVAGDKTYELRLADFECKPGDTLVLNEVRADGGLTGRMTEKTVGTVLRTKDVNFWPPEEVERYGYQIISLKDTENE
jgi:hypothetical protein